MELSQGLALLVQHPVSLSLFRFAAVGDDTKAAAPLLHSKARLGRATQVRTFVERLQPVFIPQVYAVALLMMFLSMICWGSWANTQKLVGKWRFELFYWDYVWGILILSLVVGFTLGRTDAASPDSFVSNLGTADVPHLLMAVAGGVVFNIGNILLVAAIAIAGLAVAFPIGIGLALVIGAALNYVVTPKGNPLLLFGGIALVCVAIVLDALAYRKISSESLGREAAALEAIRQKELLATTLASIGDGVVVTDEGGRVTF